VRGDENSEYLNYFNFPFSFTCSTIIINKSNFTCRFYLLHAFSEFASLLFICHLKDALSTTTAAVKKENENVLRLRSEKSVDYKLVRRLHTQKMSIKINKAFQFIHPEKLHDRNYLNITHQSHLKYSSHFIDFVFFLSCFWRRRW
jgi:hypothetical protein